MLLSRAILESPPDASTLPDLLEEHISNMFPLNSIIIHIDQFALFPTKTIFHHIAQGALVPQESLPASGEAREWLLTTSETHTFLPGEVLPWRASPSNDGIIAIPILDVEHAKTIGGIMLSQNWQPETITNLIPALQSLAGQIASALHRASIFRIEQEMAVAGKIQASFLPDEIPNIPGWQISATLKPARETSGDFYDFIPLKDGKLGLLIADVADKGTGAALYMAVCRTLIRTFAAEYDTQPELALKSANQRIITETRADLFASIFYGILDPATQTLTYCNAGHNPPYVVHPQNGSEAQKLTRTGMVIGVMEDSEWEQSTIQLASGDCLVMFTDGITDAENGQGEFFGEPRLLKTVLDHRKYESQEMQNALMTKIREFVGDAPQFDDITLMIVKRD